MNRRRFLALIGTSVPGLWLDGIGLIQLPRRRVIVISGQCSFCGKAAGEVFCLTGVVSRPARICNECIDICLEILFDNLPLEILSAPTQPPRDYPVGTKSSESFDFDLIELWRGMSLPHMDVELEAFMQQVRKNLDQSESHQQWLRRDTVSRSFCDREQKEAGKLIAGPQTYICDVCIGDAVAIISKHSYLKVMGRGAS